MNKRDSITIIVPALNEEKNILPTVEMIKRTVKDRFSDYELILVNDGSTDKTPQIMNAIAEKESNIYVLHRGAPAGLGFCYKTGITMARMRYLMMITGDNEARQESIERILDARGAADIIIPFTTNSGIRPLYRRILSRVFVILLNRLFNLRLRYFNGLVLHKTNVIRSVKIKTNSFAYQAEALIKLLKAGYTYKEVGVPLGKRRSGYSKALAPKNIADSIRAVVNTYIEVYLKKWFTENTKFPIQTLPDNTGS